MGGADFAIGTGASQEITLEWADPNLSNIIRWEYQHRVKGSNDNWGLTLIGTDPNLRSHTFSRTLTQDESYEFRVKAVRTGGHNNVVPVQVWVKISPSTQGSNKLTQTVSGLEHDKTYTFRLRAVNAIGVGASVSKTALPVAGVPGAPSLTAASGADGEVTLTWTKNSDGRWVDRWKYSTDNGANFTAVPDSGDATRSYTVDDLTNGTTYNFKVRGVNSAGNGTASAAASAEPLAKPSKPSGLSITAGHKQAALSWTASTDASTTGYGYQYLLWQVGDDGVEAVPGNAQVTLSWEDPSDSTITKWQYRKKSGQADYPATSPFGWTDVPSSGATTTSYTVASLTNGKTYAFQVRAFKGGAGQPALLEVRATPTSAGGWVNVGGSDEDTDSHTVTNLVNGRSYKARIRAVNNARPSGVGPASDAVKFSTIPAKPSGFSASGGNTQVTLSWTDPANSTITKWQARQWPGSLADFVVGKGAGTEVSLEWTGPSNSSVTKWQYSTDGSTWTDISSSDKDTRSHTVTANLTSGTRFTYQVRGFISSNNTVAATGLKAWATVSSSATATSHVVTGLVNGVAYKFRLRAVNASGVGVASNEVAPSLYPAKPANLTAEPGDQLVVLVWDDPDDSSITKYQYQQKAGQGNYGSWTNIANSGASTTSYTVGSLTNSTQYSFKVRAVNREGGSDRFGAASSEASATPIPVPSQPAGLTASASGTTVTLGWTETTDSDIKGWEYRQKAGSAAWGNWTAIQGSTSSTKSLTRSGLDAGKVYYFRVRAVNTSDVAGPGSAVASAATTPLKPTGLAASAGVRQVALSWTSPGYSSITKWQYLLREVGSGGLTGVPGNAQVALSWTNPNDSSITKWQYRKQESGQAYDSWTDVPSSNASTTSYTVTSLTNGKAYAFEVRAYKSGQGQTALDEVEATPTADGGWADMSPSSASTRTFNVTGLDSDTSYGFRIRSVNPAGKSPASDEVKVTLPDEPDAPKNLTATKTYNQASDNFTITLNWTVQSPVDNTILGWEYRAASAGTDMNTVSWTSVPGSDKDTRSYVIPYGLTGAGYSFQVRAHNTSGGGTASAVATVHLTPKTPRLTNAKKTFVPAGPSALVSSYSVKLTWDALSPADESIDNWEFRVAYGEEDTTDAEWTSRLDKAFWKKATGTSSTSTTYTVTGLSSTREEYRFQVRAVNVAGGGPASNAEEASLRPDPPGSFTAKLVAQSPKQATMTWANPNDPSITKYQYRLIEGNLAALADDEQVTLIWQKPAKHHPTSSRWQYRQKEGTASLRRLEGHIR